MMEVKVRLIDEQMCMVHFAYPYSQAIKKINELKVKNSLDQEMAEILFLNYLENNLLDEVLLEKNIIPVGDKKIHYLSPYQSNHPIIGVATFSIIFDKMNFVLPTEFSDHTYTEIKKMLEARDNSFKDALLNAKLYFNQESEVVNEESIIQYQLLYTKNGTVLNTINNQVFDLMDDDDMDESLFIGAKKNDRIIIDQDDVTIEALITKIENKVPFSASNNDIDKIKDLEYDDFEDMYYHFSKAYDYITQLDVYTDYIVEYVASHCQVEINNEVMEFYKNKEYFNYINEYVNATTLELKNKEIKKSIFLDYLSKVVDIKNENSGKSTFLDEKDYAKICEFMEDYYLGIDIDMSEIYTELTKLKLIKYCILEKIIKGVNFDL